MPDQEAVHAARRSDLVRELAAKGISSPAVLRAMAQVPRHRFISPEFAGLAYHDRALPIARSQTISQPFVVAMMTELALGGRDRICRVLEIGSGSGYQSAVLAAVSDEVYSVERIGSLHRGAADALRAVEARNVRLRCADGAAGWPEAAPFDAVVVTAAATAVEAAWLDQLVDPGILVAPLGPGVDQDLLEIRKEGGRVHRRTVLPVLFVPLLQGVED